MKKIIFFLILLLCTATAFAEDIYPSNIGSIEASVTLFGNGKISGLTQGQEVKLQTITFNENEFQKILEQTEELTINGKTYGGKYLFDEYNNKYILFTISENGEFEYKLKATIQTNSSLFNVPDYVLGQNTAGEKTELFLSPTKKIESNSIEIKTLTKNKVLENTYLTAVNKIINWVNDYVEYSQDEEFSKYYLTQRSAIETLLNKKGVCDEFANLGAAMLRAKNIPTRINIGITFDGKEWGNHAWIGTYNEKLQVWIPSDPTFREAGFVDATHIKMGSFSDITESQAKAVFPANASVSFDTQTKLPHVEIKKTNYFNEVNLQTDISEMKANRWNKIKVNITNLSQDNITAPVSIQKNYKELIIKENRKSIKLGPTETGELEFEIYPNISLSSNQIAKGTIRLNSLSQPLTKDITITAGDYDGSGELIVNDITPIAHEGLLSIRITTSNYFPEEKEIDINITGNNFELNKKKQQSAFSTQTTTEDIPDFEVIPYTVSILTPTAHYVQTLGLETQKITIEPKEIEKQTVVEQKITEPDKTISERIQENPIILLVGILIGVTILLFVLLWVNKKYV